MLVGIGLAPSGASATNYDHTCGVLPGSGYLNYVRVKNLSCRHGAKVARKSIKKFCRLHNDCAMKTDTGLYKGEVRRNGWRCKVTVGWEYERAKCRKGSMRLIHMAGA